MGLEREKRSLSCMCAIEASTTTASSLRQRGNCGKTVKRLQVRYAVVTASSQVQQVPSSPSTAPLVPHGCSNFGKCRLSSERLPLVREPLPVTGETQLLLEVHLPNVLRVQYSTVLGTRRSPSQKNATSGVAEKIQKKKRGRISSKSHFAKMHARSLLEHK